MVLNDRRWRCFCTGSERLFSPPHILLRMNSDPWRNVLDFSSVEGDKSKQLLYISRQATVRIIPYIFITLLWRRLDGRIEDSQLCGRFGYFVLRETCVISEQRQRCDISNSRTTLSTCRGKRISPARRKPPIANAFIAQRSSRLFRAEVSWRHDGASPQSGSLNIEVPGLMTDTTASLKPNQSTASDH